MCNYADPFGLSACPGALKIACAAVGRLAGAVVARSATLGAIASAARALGDGHKPLPGAIAKTFQGGQYHASKLTSELRVQRVFGGGADAAGRFLTPSAPTAETARGALQLPAQNAATHVADILIPKGTTIYTGIVDGSTAGAAQIFVRNPEVLRVLNTQPFP